MDELVLRIGESKVNQVITTNEYEQSVNYDYTSQEDGDHYDDLFKKRSKSSSTSLTSLASQSNISLEDTIFYNEDPLMYIMLYLKNPTVSIHSKDSIPRLLSDFRKTLTNDSNSFEIKKMSKLHKQQLQNKILSGQSIKDIDESLLNYFSHYLKINLVVVTKEKVYKWILCNDDGFDSVLITNWNAQGHFRLVQVDNRTSNSWSNIKKYIFEKRWFDSQFLEVLSVIEIRYLAEKMGIELYKNLNGKKTKLLKEELKIEIVKKI